MNLTGELTHAGTMNVGTDKNLCGVFVRCAPYRLKDVKSLPMYREVTVIETAELDTLRRDRDALLATAELILPMAKGYAAAHPVATMSSLLSRLKSQLVTHSPPSTRAREGRT